MRRILLTRVVLATLLLTGLASFAPVPTATGQDGARTFIGRVAGAEAMDALVAVVVAADGSAAAYSCSADDGWNQQYSKWFTGQLDAQGQLTARANDGTELTARLQGQRLEGTLGSLQWTAELASPPAGLYRGRADDEIHGVIQAADGTRVGRVWSVTTGAHVNTWDFRRATVEQGPGVLRAQRNEPQFIFVELQVCTNAFCGL